MSWSVGFLKEVCLEIGESIIREDEGLVLVTALSEFADEEVVHQGQT